MTDGDVVGALERFQRAVVGLVDPIVGTVEGAVRQAPSLYGQLVSAVSPSRGQRPGASGRRVPGSRPTVWCAALDQLQAIDGAVAGWIPAEGSLRFPPRCPTPDRLRLLAGASWRPQDSTALETASTTVEQWQEAIRHLLDPLPVLELSVRCPACSARYFHRHKDGERVRVSALQVTAAGATCLACEHRWAPDTFVELARELGVMPENVLE